MNPVRLEESPAFEPLVHKPENSPAPGYFLHPALGNALCILQNAYEFAALQFAPI